jgi:hypothetical protein
MALPNPGIITSNLLSKSQSSFAKRASELCASGGGIGTDSTSDRSRELTIVDESTFICSADKGKVGLTQSSRSSGMISNIGATAAAMAPPSVVDETVGEAEKDNKLSPARGEKQP